MNFKTVVDKYMDKAKNLIVEEVEKVQSGMHGRLARRAGEKQLA